MWPDRELKLMTYSQAKVDFMDYHFFFIWLGGGGGGSRSSTALPYLNMSCCAGIWFDPVK